MILPPYVSRELVLERLPLIFPTGTPARQYIIREIGASTVFTMLYMGAVEGNDFYIGPLHVYRMTNEQAALSDDEDRLICAEASLKKGFKPHGKPWYADTTRESIRDETLREGLVQLGAVLMLPDIPTTSSKPRYSLQKAFTALFDPKLVGKDLEIAIKEWQEENLTRSAIARISLANHTSKSAETKILVTFPNGEARNLSPGISSVISKAVVEVFSKIFLENPALLWLSTSAAKVPYLDNQTANAVGLKIKPDKDLPDIILADLGRKYPLLVFVEVVATDGPISERRQNAIFELTDAAGFKRDQVTFVTAYQDKLTQASKKTLPHLAWNSFAWFMSEPDKIVHFKDGTEKIADMI